MSRKTDKQKIQKILGEYKVIGDTTFGLGYKEAEELTDKILQVFKDYSPLRSPDDAIE